MFKQPLTNQETPTLSTQLWTLSEAYYEFHCYREFFTRALIGLAAQSEEMDDSTAYGAHLAAQWATERSEQIKRRLEELVEIAGTQR